MAMALDLRPRKPGAGRAPLVGIPEWYCWLEPGDGPAPEPERVMDECVDAHVAARFDWIAWNVGRSRVDYWTSLPNATRLDDGVPPGVHTRPGLCALVMAGLCPLRAALARCAARGVSLLARLCMNRHYGPDEPELRSRFAASRPELAERARNGEPVVHKLCYAFEETRQERIDILLEVQRIGVAGLVLDFCRQPPLLLYHEALAAPFAEAMGVDPRHMDSDRPEDWREWFQYRADVLTGFMRATRRAVRAQESLLGRPCPIIARIPDNAGWLTLAYGIDIERWLADDLVDAVMLSPFPLAAEDLRRHPEYHIDLAHKHGKACIGGVGSLGLVLGDGAAANANAEALFYPGAACRLAERQLAAGADAMSLYQTETVARLSYLKDFVARAPDLAALRLDLARLPDKEPPEGFLVGMDWHSKRPGVGGQGRKSPHRLRAAGALGL